MRATPSRRPSLLVVDDRAPLLAATNCALATACAPELDPIRGSSAQVVGATGFAGLCQALEDLRAGGSLEQAGAIVQAMPPLAQVSAGIAREFA